MTGINTLKVLLNRNKPILTENIQKEIVEFKSLKEASKHLGISRVSIIEAIKKNKPTKNYYFQYKYNYEKLLLDLEIAGERIHEITILENTIYEDKYRIKQILGRCSCGVVKRFTINSMFSGKVQSCGHTRGKEYIDRTDFVGKDIDNTVVLSLVKENVSKIGRSRYKCKCRCGNIFETYRNKIEQDKQLSCGECTNMYMLEARKHISETWGRLTIKDIFRKKSNSGKHTYYYVCSCSCGSDKTSIISYADLKSGHTQSCGCYCKEVSSKNATIRAKNNFVSKEGWYFYNKGKKIECKSSYEALFGAYLDHKNISFEYEPKTFILEKHRRYTPDFYLIEENKYIETKGYDNNPYQQENIKKVSETENIEVFHLEQIKNFIKYPLKDLVTYYRRAKIMGISKSDYIATIFSEDRW